MERVVCLYCEIYRYQLDANNASIFVTNFVFSSIRNKSAFLVSKPIQIFPACPYCVEQILKTYTLDLINFKDGYDEWIAQEILSK